MARRDEQVMERVRAALDLFEMAEAMLRQKLVRQHPEASMAELDAWVEAWRLRRPTEGDADGKPRRWPPRP